MKSLLIPTKPDDSHAFYVKSAIESLGYAVDLWNIACYPTSQTLSFLIGKGALRWEASGLKEQGNKEYDVVWLRRPAKPVMPDYLHPDDLETCTKENLTFIQTMWECIAPNAKWINPIHSANRAKSKLLQLKVASELKFDIPDTLVSNHPEQIKGFLSKHHGNVIHKTLHPALWKTSEDIRLSYTEQVSIDLLPHDPILQSTPGIFQEKIPKQYELRITYFDDHYIAVKINSQTHPKARTDWRYAPAMQLSIEETQLPDWLHQRCLQFMKQFGLVFGCFDFIVTPDNQYVFMEINEQGQFLWIEDVNPDIKILHAFTRLVLSGLDPNATLGKTLSLADFHYKAT